MQPRGVTRSTKIGTLSKERLRNVSRDTFLCPETKGEQHYRIDRGERDTSRQISFEFLFIKTRPPDKLRNGFGFVIQFRVRIRYVMRKGGHS